MPIVPELSACGDTGRPLVLVDPAGAVADVYGAVAAKVVQEVAKLKVDQLLPCRLLPWSRSWVAMLPWRAERHQCPCKICWG